MLNTNFWFENIYLDNDWQEEMMKGKHGYEHLNEPLHILVEAELPVDIIDSRLKQAREIIEDLLKPMVNTFFTFRHFRSSPYLYW